MQPSIEQTTQQVESSQEFASPVHDTSLPLLNEDDELHENELHVAFETQHRVASHEFTSPVHDTPLPRLDKESHENESHVAFVPSSSLLPLLVLVQANSGPVLRRQ